MARAFATSSGVGFGTLYPAIHPVPPTIPLPEGLYGTVAIACCTVALNAFNRASSPARSACNALNWARQLFSRAASSGSIPLHAALNALPPAFTAPPPPFNPPHFLTYSPHAPPPPIAP